MEVSLDPQKQPVPTAETLSPEQALKEISRLVQEADAAVMRACKFADQYDLSFNWDLAYGMGGTYYGGDSAKNSGWGSSHDGGWIASSEGC